MEINVITYKIIGKDLVSYIFNRHMKTLNRLSKKEDFTLIRFKEMLNQIVQLDETKYIRCFPYYINIEKDENISWNDFISKINNLIGIYFQDIVKTHTCRCKDFSLYITEVKESDRVG
jgi:hypothetical protein